MNAPYNVAAALFGVILSLTGFVLVLLRLIGVVSTPLGLPAVIALVGMVLCLTANRRNTV